MFVFKSKGVKEEGLKTELGQFKGGTGVGRYSYHKKQSMFPAHEKLTRKFTTYNILK